MREILFRGKQADSGKWVYGFISGLNNDEYGIPMTMNDTEGLCDIIVNPITVGQYTGLTDKNGRRVFEGDICWFYGGEHYGGNWETSAVIAITDMTNFTIMQYFYDAEYFEVIGNIHDNPELLEGFWL